MKKKILVFLLSCAILLAQTVPVIAVDKKTVAKENVIVENGNKIQEYITEDGKNHTIYWAKGVDGPLMSGKKGADKKYGDFTGIIDNKGTEFESTMYATPYVEGKGYYDLNKKDVANDHRCYMASTQNILYWWMDQNSDYINQYIDGLDAGKYVQSENLTRLTKEEFAKIKEAPKPDFDSETKKIGQYIDDSYIVNNYYGAYNNLGTGYYMDKVADFFINGYLPTEGVEPNRQDEYTQSDKAGFFYPIFGKNRISKRNITSRYDFYNTNMKNWILDGTGITIAHTVFNESHAISVWGVEYDENGNLCRIYVTDSNDIPEDSVEGKGRGMYSYNIADKNGTCYIGTYTNMTPNDKRGTVLRESVTVDLGQDTWKRALNDSDTTVESPIINSQPVSRSYGLKAKAEAITAGAELSADDISKNAYLTYQWYKADSKDDKGTIIEGATNASYIPVIGDTPKTEYYYCKVTNNKYGKKATIKTEVSEIVTLDVSAVDAKEPKIIINTKNPMRYIEGQTTNPLKVDATSTDGGIITYQWYSSYDANPYNGTPIKGQTSNEFMPPTNVKGDKFYYFCKITNTNEKATGKRTSKINSNMVRVYVEEALIQEPLHILNVPTEVISGTEFELKAEGGSGITSVLTWEVTVGSDIATVEKTGDFTAKVKVTGVGEFTVTATNNAEKYKPVSDSVTITSKAKSEPEKKIATQFAPNVTKDIGWYDTNKIYGAAKDSKMCWAASCSNSIAWYIDQLGPDGNIFEGNHNNIYKNFREIWSGSDEGFDPLQGFSWYFTGHTTDSKDTHPGTGGYLNTLKGCNEKWSVIPELGPGIFGNYENKIPYVYDEIGIYYEGAALSTYELMSKTLLEQLKQGVCVLSVARGTSVSTWSHAITLWGADYDENTGLITKLYVTDSDDEDGLPGSNLKELAVKRSSNPGDMGYRIDGYHLSGNEDPITKIIASTLLYKPENIILEHVHTLNLVDKVEPTCMETGRKAYYHCDGCGKNFKDEKCTEEVIDLSTLDIDAKGHSYGEWNKDPDNHWHECSDCQNKADVKQHTFKWIKDREPSKELPGLTHEECTVCGYKKAQVEYTNAEEINPPIVKPEPQPEPEVYEDEIKLDKLYKVPDGLNYKTVDHISEALKEAIDKVADKNNIKTEVFDVILNVYDNGTYRPATKEEIEARENIKVVLPYPAGTNAKDYKFVVAHMATMAVNGLKPGDIETPEVTATEEGLIVYLKGLSPVMISYSKITNEPAVEEITTPATGDTSNVGIWVMVLLAAIAVIVVIVIKKIRYNK